jgi:DNA-binding CsgD family transcriptional regulator/PAS domain-containing protein
MSEPDLIGLIYDSVADTSRWSVFLEAFVRTTNGKCGTLVINTPEKDGWRFVCFYGWSEEDSRLYADRYAAIDPWRVATEQSAEGEVRTSHQLCSQEELEQSIAYREFYCPRGCDCGFGGIFLRLGSTQSAITMLRAKNEQGLCGEREVSILRPLMPHLRRAALLHGEVASLRGQLATFTSHLDRYPHAFFLTDSETRVLYANAAAREIAALGNGLKIENGRIRLTAPRQSTALLEALGDIAAGRGAPVRRMDAPRRHPIGPYRLLIMNVPGSSALPLGVSQPAATILVIDNEASSEPDLTILRELFSLTKAEARITAKLALGRSVEEMATDLGITVETARTHVRRVLSKTSTGRQGELISLVLRMAPFRRL